jgi:hypothetical protein
MPGTLYIEAVTSFIHKFSRRSSNHAMHIAWRAESRGYEGDVYLLPTM